MNAFYLPTKEEVVVEWGLTTDLPFPKSIDSTPFVVQHEEAVGRRSVGRAMENKRVYT